MDTDFDPYLKWLGIAPADQPANHYRLLSIPELIDDADVIENAADRQMAHVRTFAGGQHAELSQRLLNEIAKAKVCLLDPQAKQAYDQKLRSAAALQAPPAAPTRPVLKTRQAPQTPLPQAQRLEPAPAATAHPLPHTAAARKKNKSTTKQAAIAAGLLIVAVGLAWGFYLATSGDSVVAEQESETNTPETPPVEPTKQTTPPTEDVTESPTPPKEKPPKDQVPTTPVVEKPETTETVATNDPQNSPAAGESIDLLKRIDLTRDVVEGQWKMDGGVLVSPESPKTARVMLPGAVPEEYRLTLEVERVTGDNAFVVGLVAAGKQVESYLDSHGGDKSLISGLINDNNPSQSGKVLTGNPVNVIEYQVTSSRILATVNGQTVIDCPRVFKLGIHPVWAVPHKEVLFLGSQNSSFRIHKVVLAPLDEVAVASTNPPFQKNKPIDLLKKIDLKRDVVEGRWQLDDQGLVVPADATLARLMVPYTAPEAYALDIEVERTTDDNMLLVGLVVRGKQTHLGLDYHHPGQAPYSVMTPKEKFPPQTGPLLSSGKPHHIRCQVTHSRLIVWVDGKLIFDQRDRLDELEMAEVWKFPRNDVLSLGGHHSGFRITKYELTPLDDAAVAATEQPIGKSKEIDLLKQIDVERDAVQGGWSFDRQTLVTPAGQADIRLMVPSAVPEEYLLEMDVERVTGDNMFLVVLIVGGKQVQLFFDYHGSGQTPHSSIAPVGKFPIKQGTLLPQGKTRRLRCLVTRSRVRVWVDDEVVLDVSESLNEMMLSDHWKIPRTDILALGTQYSSFRIHRFTLTPLADGKLPAAVDDRLPLPEGEPLTKAQATLRDVFKDDLAVAKTAKDRSALAQSILSASDEPGSDPTEVFVMLQAARKLAAKAGDAQTAITAIERLGDHFAIDPLELKAEALAAAAKEIRQQEQQAALVTLAGGIVLEMVEADRFDLAEPLTKVVQSAAIKSRNVALRKEVSASIKQFKSLHDAYRKVEPAFEKLQTASDDPEANLMVGRYRAMIKHDWSTGLENLAAGSDESLKALAKQDLAGADTSGDQVKLGDAWWDAAKAQSGATQKALKARAGHWYRQAVVELTGLTKERVNKRLVEILAIDPAQRVKPGDWVVKTIPSEGTWIPYPPEAITRDFSGGILTVTRKPTPGRSAFVVFQPFVGDSPFVASMEVRGNFAQLGMQSANAHDSHVAAVGPGDNQWHTFTIQRSADKTLWIAMDGKVVEPRIHRTDGKLVGSITIWLASGQSCSIRRFHVQAAPKR